MFILLPLLCGHWRSSHIHFSDISWSALSLFLSVNVYLSFQAAVVSILLYGCTTWTLTKRLEKKLDGNYTRMLRAILNKSWRQHPTRHQLYGHLPPITKTIQVRGTRHAGHWWRSRDELISDVLLWTPTYGRAKAGRPARTYIQQLCEDTGCIPEDLPEAMNDRGKYERESGISVLAARHDDDDDDPYLKAGASHSVRLWFVPHSCAGLVVPLPWQLGDRRAYPQKRNMPHNSTRCSEGKFRILVWRANLIRHLISPNLDDLSYSARTFISG